PDPSLPLPVAYRPDPGGLEPAASRCRRSRARHAYSRGVGGRAKALELMTTQVLVSNTKTHKPGDPEKINTGTTRTKRYYPAHGGTGAKMAVYPPRPATMQVKRVGDILRFRNFRYDRPSVNRQVIGSSSIAGAL